MNAAVIVLLLLIIFRSIHRFIKLSNAKNNPVPAAKPRL
jgi:hypothetical protein